MYCRSNAFQAAAELRLFGRKGKDSMRTTNGEAIHEKREEQAGHPLILIIDDSICVRKIVETTLRREGYATMGFADGPTALRWLSSEDVRTPALIILDLTLPKLDGYTVLRCLKKRKATARIPVVILSGRTGMIDRLKGRLAGACVYLTKPFRQQAILDVVRAQLLPSDTQDSCNRKEMVRPQAAVAAPRPALHSITLQRMEAVGW